eukprot:gene8174-9609_t
MNGTQYTDEQLAELAPSDITFDTNLFSLNFHPTDDLVVVSDAEGAVKLYRYGLEQNECLLALRPHKSGCRQACFSTDGKYIFTASSDCSIKVIDVNTGATLYTREEAHDDPINSLVSKQFMVFTGDDEGTVKVWDMRQQSLVCEFQEHADYISDIVSLDDNHIVATSGDGGLSIYNFVRRSLDDISAKSDNELLSVVALDHGDTLVCGTQDGTIKIFDRHNLEAPKKFVGHPASVDTLVKVGSTTFLSGSSDGIIRYVGTQPRKLLGVIGEHSTFPVERIAVSRDNRYLGSISHDLSLKFWNVVNLYEDDSDDEDNEAMNTMEHKMEDDEAESSEGEDSDPDQNMDEEDDSQDEEDSGDEGSGDDDDSSDDSGYGGNRPSQKQFQAAAKAKWSQLPNKSDNKPDAKKKDKRKSFFSDL